MKTRISENEYFSALDKLFDDGRVVDQKALTIRELSKKYHRSYSQSGKIAKDSVQSGKLEEVKKLQENGRYIAAYRPKQ